MGKIDKQCSCGRDAVIFLPYAKRHLCDLHFSRMFERRVKKTFRERAMAKKGEKVVVSLSGGKDSSVLLYSLKLLQQDLPMELAALTVDEGIGRYRSAGVENAKRECERLGIEHHMVSFQDEIGSSLDAIMEKSSVNTPCSYCGIIRRYIINRQARRLGADRLAVGHNLDDTAQTILMNIMRNEPQRLARLGRPLVDHSMLVPRMRPLMRSPENEIVAYAKLKGIVVLEKSCPYQQFAYRRRVRGMLESMENEHPGTKFKILNSFLEMEEMLHRSYSGDATIDECRECGEPCSHGICKFCSLITPLLGKS
ncbi:TIGR00269 family protein [Candidatus Micrarchaeota archaeon]|nr:TIGR00269 family protein [Candidatus Micrarchaeota archaeon]